eukprot:TRINITY_DN9788_c0_g2_i3.p1 TRINITY_DN9788_c0_g2~~TRINITY_DN9788_c0_g2_i3.p1  ORF type:complete len:291 (+),score=39.87 TRINITY_DN9788_c0_g2_i3:283-1155(+)
MIRIRPFLPDVSLTQIPAPRINLEGKSLEYPVPESKRKFKCEIVSKVEKESKESTRGRWTKEEKLRFIEAIEKYGKNWKKVGAYVGTRSATQIRSHAQKVFPKNASRQLKPTEPDSHSGSPTHKTNLVLEKPEAITRAPATPVARLSQKLSAPLTEIQKLEERAMGVLRKRATCGEKIGRSLELQGELIEVSQEALVLLKKAKDSHEATERCHNIIQGVNCPILEMAKDLKGVYRRTVECSCEYLVQSMLPYGFRSLNEIQDNYHKLGDWVDTKARRQWSIPIALSLMKM